MRIAIAVGVLAAALAVFMAAADEKATAAAAPAAPPAPPVVSLEPGKTVPDFTLKDLNGKSYTLSKLTADGNVVVLEWFNYGCPVVKRYRVATNFMNDTAATFAGKPVIWLAICSSAPGNEGGDPAEAAEFATETGMTMPILYDADGAVGHAFHAVTTPHMFVVNAKRELVYVGAPDTSAPIDKTPKGENLIIPAVNAALEGKLPAVTSTKPFGCSVKYAK
jgi:peroxiredoxin